MLSLATSLALLLPLHDSEAPVVPVILPARERAAVRDRWLGLRLDTVVPELMRREGVDLWIVSCREYDEDPLFRSLAPAKWLNARRRTILVFHDPGEGRQLERMAVARYAVGEFYEGAWDKGVQPDQWKRLAEIVRERDPERIAINRSTTFALGDGLSSTEYEQLFAALDETYQDRLVGGERLAIGWLERRIPEEMQAYPTLCRIAHAILAEGLSARAIQPGVTTTEDLEWWFRDRLLELRLGTWFHPSVSLQRPDAAHSDGFASPEASQVIQRGDLLHVDFGITYLGLNTDTQEHAYVLREGESEAPAGLRAALREGNRLQDLLTGSFSAGATGNEILAATLEKAAAAGIDAVIYTHPLGFHGHGAGPTIGLWDQQGGVPGRGDYPLYPSTAHSIELMARVHVPEWDTVVRIMLEQDAFFDGREVRYLDGRQTELHLVH